MLTTSSREREIQRYSDDRERDEQQKAKLGRVVKQSEAKAIKVEQ